jgi:predicted nucleotide-binding protein
MITRFQGEDGHARLITALRAQRIVLDDEALAQEIANIAPLLQVEPNAEFIRQGATDNDVYLILSGIVSVRVNGREVAVRASGFHVGEMAVIDPGFSRSASVVALEQTVMAKIAEASFSKLAEQFPQLWRRLAVELGGRLRQRGRFVSSPNPEPVVFIGSSAESLDVAREIQLGFSHDKMLVSVWTDGVFKASRTAIESLLSKVKASDFAILLVTPDDIVASRDIETPAPRDNVVFELGLFMALLGRERTFVVKPRGVRIKTPSDLLGFSAVEYAEGSADTLTARVAPVCTELRKAIRELGPS